MKRIIGILVLFSLCIGLVSCGGDGYKVTFETNGGNKMKSKKYEIMEEAPIPTREGYAFDGWFYDGALGEAVEFPLEVTSEMTLYAAWFKTVNSIGCERAAIKFLSDIDDNRVYDITPTCFDTEELISRGYNVEIKVTYKSSYTRDWKNDFGYLGAPKYDISILNSDGKGVLSENIIAAADGDERAVTYVYSVSELKDIKLKLKTQNIQNTVVFNDIVVTYTAVAIEK